MGAPSGVQAPEEIAKRSLNLFATRKIFGKEDRLIVFIYGTTAEAIKIAPIARRLEKRGIEYEQWLTLQHTDALLDILPSLGLKQPDQVIARGKEGEPLRSVGDVFSWLNEIRRWMKRNVRTLRRTLPAGTVVVVHGDTMTSVVGAWIARQLKVDSAHIEAGLRSGNWRHPFPEELDRRIVGRLATVHYTPSEEATRNLRKRKNVIHTHGNTALDAVLDQAGSPTDDNDPYGVVLLHRFEFLTNRPLVDSTFSTLAKESPLPLHFFIDEFAKETLADILPATREKFIVRNKLKHEAFVDLLRGAEFIVTDSGGTQAEAALLGVPTLVHRRATEQFEGIGGNIVLSEWKSERLRAFLKDYEQHRREPVKPEFSPSDIIVDDLVARGYGS